MSWFEMQVHQVKGDPTLKVPFYPIDLHLSPDVQDLAPRDLGLGDRLVDALVLFDPFPEIPFGLFLAHVLVVGITRPSLERDVGGDNLGVVAPGFEEDALETGFAVDPLLDLGPVSHQEDWYSAWPLKSQSSRLLVRSRINPPP